MKKTIIALVIIILIIVAGYFVFRNTSNTTSVNNTNQNTATSTNTSENNGEATTTTQTENKPTEVIGKSAEGRDIVAYHFGTGDKELLFVAGLHGGYEWNTALMAYQFIDYLKANPSIIPAGEKITIIPDANPDGLYRVTGKTGAFTASDVNTSNTIQVEGRFNGNNVDLNRNFDCDWQPTGKWQLATVSGGDVAFSEPESAAIEKYVTDHKPTAAVVYYSAAGGVFASSCHNGVLSDTTTLTNLYADASGYKAYESFDFYQITGDMVNWLAKERIPAISVLLTNHTDTEWNKNLAGISAVLNHYAQ